MTALRFGLRLPPCAPADVVADAAAHAEQLGWDAVWLPDSQLLWRDVWVVAALAAQRTTRLRIGTAVTNVETRHATVLASAVRTVQELAGDRLVVGVGTGNSSLGLIGTRPTPQTRMREAFGTVRALLAGADLELGGGRLARLRDVAGVPPLFLAASGPRNLALAGELADGAILLCGTSPALLDDARHRVRAGARQAGRDPGEVALVVSAFTHLTDDPQRDARLLKPLCAALSVTGGGAALAAAGIEVDHLPPRVARIYPDLVHAEDWDVAIEILDDVVSDEAALRFAREFCLFGTAADVRAGVERLAAHGVTEVQVQHVGSYDLPYELMETFASAVFADAPAHLAR